MEDLISDAYEQRLILLLENEDFNGFNQVMLNSEQFKKISDACFRDSRVDPSLKPGYEMGTILLSEETYPSEPFDGLNSINEDDA
jgi:hypothetical protein